MPILVKIVYDKDGVVEGCIVLVKIPLTRFESFWTPLKPQHSNPNPNPLANQLWSIDFLTPPTPLIIPHRLLAFHESLIPLKNWCSIHARWVKRSPKYSIRFCAIFSKFKTEFYCILFFGSVTTSRFLFLKCTSCEKCILIPAVGIHLNLKS